MRKITLTIGAMAMAALIDTQPGHASVEGPWCAFEKMGLGSVSSRCDLPSYQACRAWMNASPGTWCTENPHYRVTDKPARRKTKHTR